MLGWTEGWGPVQDAGGALRMRRIEVEGKTMDEALDRAARDLGVSRDEVRYEVLERSRGLLGFLGRSSVTIRAWVEPKGEEIATRFLEGLLHRGGWECTAVAKPSAEGGIMVELQGAGAKEVIGREGEVLDAIQYLVDKVVNRGRSERCKVVVDAQGFRAGREEELRRRALDAARRARDGKPVILGPLNARDRRIIHLTLKEEPGVTTRSIGDGPMRRVVVSAEETKGRDRTTVSQGRASRG